MKPYRESPGQAMVNEHVAGPWRSGSSLNQAASIQQDDSEQRPHGSRNLCGGIETTKATSATARALSAGFPGGQTVMNLFAMQEMQVHSLGWEDPLEKEMATHSIIPAWRTPCTEEPGRLQFTGSQRVRHD